MQKDLVLITGANGFIGARTVEAFLRAGYSVRGTTRSSSSSRITLDAFPEHALSGQLTTVIVPDITTPGAFDEVVKGVTAIAHIASPNTVSTEDEISIASESTIGLLNSALKEPGIQSFVFMSSLVTMWSHFPIYKEPAITEKDWNNSSEIALAESTNESEQWYLRYIVSKVKAERAFWEFRKKNLKQIKFSMSTIHPAYVGGPPLILPKEEKHFGDSLSIVFRILTGQEVMLPRTGIVYVDVRDVAELIVFAAREAGAADGKRFIAAWDGNLATVKNYRDILRKAYPSRAEFIAEGEPGQDHPKHNRSDQRLIDSTKTEKITGQRWIPFKKMALDTAKSCEIYL
jgi:nucleoside-diphosphate-sugar epimerase